MTTTTIIHGGGLRDAAKNIGPTLAEHARRHDDEGSFVAEAFDVLRSSGYLASPVPVELGGGGATTEEVAWAQHELARHCASSALASTMHLHVVLVNAWRWRRGMPGAEGMLRKVAADGMVVASTGGGDFLVPSGLARRVDGGYDVTARKSFVSGAPAAAVASAWAMTDDGEAIAFGVPLGHPAVRVDETWDAPGMRGTASHDVVVDGFFVADEAITGRRAPGAFAPVLAIVAAKALSVIAATYLGVATAARDEAIARCGVGAAAREVDPGVRRGIGMMEHHLRSATWILEGLFRELGEDPPADPATFAAAVLAKRAVIEHARAVGDLAMDVVGGRCYRHGDPLERAWRDLRAGPFHPLDHELTLRVAGDVALGRPIAMR